MCADRMPGLGVVGLSTTDSVVLGVSTLAGLQVVVPMSDDRLGAGSGHDLGAPSTL